MIWRKEISTRGESLPPLGESLPLLDDSFPPLAELFPLLRELLPPLAKIFPLWEESFPPLRESFSLRGESLPPLADLFPPLRESLPPLGESLPLKRNEWLMHRNSFLPIHNRSFLQDIAFISGYKAFIFIFTLFRRRNRFFPISCELFRQRGGTSAFGKNQVVLI